MAGELPGVLMEETLTMPLHLAGLWLSSLFVRGLPAELVKLFVFKRVHKRI
jgi:hypothetical protein